jgi:hypothetical protein
MRSEGLSCRRLLYVNHSSRPCAAFAKQTPSNSGASLPLPLHLIAASIKTTYYLLVFSNIRPFTSADTILAPEMRLSAMKSIDVTDARPLQAEDAQPNKGTHRNANLPSDVSSSNDSSDPGSVSSDK